MDYRDVIATIAAIGIIWGGIQLGYLFPAFLSSDMVEEKE